MFSSLVLNPYRIENSTKGIMREEEVQVLTDFFIGGFRINLNKANYVLYVSKVIFLWPPYTYKALACVSIGILLKGVSNRRTRDFK